MSLSPAPVTPPAPRRSRPSSLSEILDEAFRAYRRQFVVLAALSLGVQLPDVIATAVKAPGASLISLVMLPLILAVVYRAASDAIAGRTVAFGGVLRGALRRYLSFAGVLVCYVVAVFACVIPPLGIWLVVRWALAPSALVTDSMKAGEAVKRSAYLVKGAWWRTFGILLTVGVLNLVIVAILSLSVGVFVGLLPGLDSATQSLVARGAGGVVGALVTPFVPLAYVFLYLDLRVRKEGTDLDGLARSAGQAA